MGKPGFLQLFLLAVIVFSTLALTFNPSQAASKGKIVVAVSIPPLAEWVEKVGGNRVEALVLIPKGASPHLYEPPPSTLLEACKAKLIVMVGLGLEPWTEKIIQINPEAKILRVAEGVKLRSLEGKPDPHVWLSLKVAVKAVSRIAQALAELDPDHAGFYRENAEAYQAELLRLHREIETMLSKFKGETLLVAHPAWGYFADDYGLKQLFIGDDPSPARVASVIEKARSLGIKTVFAEPFSSLKTVELVAGEIGGKILFLDPLPADYVEGLRRNALTIMEGLKDG
ncbi:MAG: zinc ABC transporter substrate-binding protein [Candidatus Hecatellales archaeon]|nr:MAG: zinc ABC transporter substrate-binding protein [Candidatus Hecatellales archaeon]